MKISYSVLPGPLTKIPNSFRWFAGSFAAALQSSNEEDAVAKESYMLVDATLKEPFPPVSLPRREFMERAAEIWKELKLPELKPEYPWFGFSLGDWTEENQHECGEPIRTERNCNIAGFTTCQQRN